MRNEYLTPKNKTGDKIVANYENFKFKLLENELIKGCIVFSWKFCDVQNGAITIWLDSNKQIEEVTMITLENSLYPFEKSLSLSNDPSLKRVISLMLKSIEVK
ncbi:hypothetical protein H5J22_02630 [Cetobacterium sp. 8H]|uniref:hypothetical protein n=1 Tax=Cetobacterium sp. 8H TaxID=2759681 RepID=UPI00163CB6D0|nr:hypothetical protein [Cetobacterium sp. 8H]MBC2850339.1 hypothetical protein [Cetobacterium sp. 8H]